MATAKTKAAAQRQTPFWACSPGASRSRNQTKNGTSTIRSIVRTFGRFQIREADPALGSALFTFLGYRLRTLPSGERPGVLCAVLVAGAAIGAVVIVDCLGAVLQVGRDEVLRVTALGDVCV